MKKQNKQKGFTLVELVIVIAVIAILAGVLIPTFSGIVEKANKSAVEQVAASLYKEALALDLADGVQDGYEGEKTEANKISSIENKTVTYTFDTKGEFEKFEYTDSEKGYTSTFDGTKWTTAKKTDEVGE